MRTLKCDLIQIGLKADTSISPEQIRPEMLEVRVPLIDEAGCRPASYLGQTEV